jgi:GntR family transcriptional regulator
LNQIAMRPDFSRSAISRYVQLAALFRRRIETGVWPVGSQIPTVDELAEECGVARATIRQSLGLLSDEKLIERYRAKGTFVTGRVRDGLWCAIATDWSGMLLPSTDDSRIEVASQPTRNIPLPIYHQIGTAADAYDHVQRRHWRDDRAYLIANIYIASSLRKSVSRADLANKTVMRMASDILGSDIGDATHSMTIGSADLVAAEFLSIPVNAPVAYVRREVTDKSGTLMFVSDGVYPGDVVRIDIKLDSGQGRPTPVAQEPKG